MPYPKTLFPIEGKPILVRILELLAASDACPTVVVSPDGLNAVRDTLLQRGLSAHLVVQPSPRGMGDAVLQHSLSPAFEEAEHVLLIWGDCPFIQPETISKLLAAHESQNNDFTFATRYADKAYTIVERDGIGGVKRVLETREAGILKPLPGERDIGLFVYRSSAVVEALREELPGKHGASTGEHGFLYVIEILVSRGFRVAALPIATELDTVSFNSIEDVRAFL